MRFPFGVGVLVACGVAFAAPVPKEKDKAKTDDEALQGTWQLDKFDGPGGPPPGDASGIQFIFADGKLTVALPGGRGPGAKQGTYKLDSAAKPKTIDLSNGDQPALGIYELDGDTFKLCLSEGPKMARPTEFKPDANTRAVVVTFKRVKDEKKDKKSPFPATRRGRAAHYVGGKASRSRR